MPSPEELPDGFARDLASAKMVARFIDKDIVPSVPDGMVECAISVKTPHQSRLQYAFALRSLGYPITLAPAESSVHFPGVEFVNIFTTPDAEDVVRELEYNHAYENPFGNILRAISGTPYGASDVRHGRRVSQHEWEWDGSGFEFPELFPRVWMSALISEQMQTMFQNATDAELKQYEALRDQEFRPFDFEQLQGIASRAVEIAFS